MRRSKKLSLLGIVLVSSCMLGCAHTRIYFHDGDWDDSVHIYPHHYHHF